MADGLVRSESPVEFFKEQVEDVMQRQRLQASDWTVYYIVNLLASFVTRPTLDGAVDAPIGVRLVRALEGDGEPRRDDLRRIADGSLFVAGFFGDSFQRRLVDVDYYITVGGYAYQRLAAEDADAFADVFGELAEKFVRVVDVLSEIGDRSRPTDRDVLRLYERWLRTGSPRDRALLSARGLTAIPSRRVQ
jgi:hypothetical protein